MHKMMFMLPTVLYDDIKTLSKLYKVSIGEMLRAGAVIVVDRYTKHAENLNKQPRPDIDKVLNQEQTNSHG